LRRRQRENALDKTSSKKVSEYLGRDSRNKLIKVIKLPAAKALPCPDSSVESGDNVESSKKRKRKRDISSEDPGMLKDFVLIS